MFRCAHAELSGVGRIRRSRHPAMGFACGFGGIVPFHHACGSFINLLCGERDKGSGRAPLINPRGPARKSVLRTALTSRVPDCGRLDSVYSFHPWDALPRGQRKRCSKLHPAILSCLGSPLSAIHGVQTLSSTLRFADFSGDTTPRCHIADKSHTGVAVGSIL